VLYTKQSDLDFLLGVKMSCAADVETALAELQNGATELR